MNNSIQSLYSLRFIFIYLIVLSHFSWGNHMPIEFGGDCGVAFFFMLSGFILTLNHNPSFSGNSDTTIAFIKRRFYKIYPLHLFCLIVALITCPWILSSDFKFIPSVFLLQSWFPDNSIYFGGNGVAWFLSDIMFFYILFPITCRFIISTNITRLISLIFILIAAYSLYNIFLVPQNKINYLLYVFPPIRFLDFCFGIALARLFIYVRNLHWTPKRTLISFLESSTIILFILTALIYPIIPYRFATVLLFWIPSALIILVFSLFNDRPGHIGRLLHSKLLTNLGKISFEIFLIHTTIISIISRICHKLDFTLPYIFALIILTIIIVTFAHLIHTHYPIIWKNGCNLISHLKAKTPDKLVE